VIKKNKTEFLYLLLILLFKVFTHSFKKLKSADDDDATKKKIFKKRFFKLKTNKNKKKRCIE